MSIHKFYIRLLILSAVLGPLAWLMFTDEGQRVGDIFMLELGDSEPLNLNFSQLSTRVDEQTLLGQFPQIKFRCAEQKGTTGARFCTSPISAINGAPAQYINVFFYHDRLAEVKVGYQPSYHTYVYNYLVTNFGEGEAVPGSDIRRWRFDGGSLFTPPESMTLDKEAALLWLAGDK